MCTAELLDQMVVTSKHSPRNFDEMKEAGLEGVPCEKVGPPRLKNSPIAMECKHMQTIDMPTPQDGSRAAMVLGHVVQIHVADEVITDEGLIDMRKLRPVGRLGYYDYTIVEPENIFPYKTPDDDRFHGHESKAWDEIQPRVEEFVQE